MSKPEWIPEDANPNEERLIREHIVKGSDLAATSTVPDSLPGLIQLRPDERPAIGVHFVVWGSVLLNDIRERPVKRSAVSEDEYARKMRSETEWLVTQGLKDPDPNIPMKYARSRTERAEQYARWRYKGFVCGEVHSL
jgi:hypothetical protein